LCHAVLILILTLVLALTGCGGGSDGGGGGNPGGISGYTGVAFTMVDVPLQSYEIAQTEVTYELWSAVYTWAFANGYNIANPGRQGGDNSGTDPVGTNQHPVTTISWRDAIVWCNALTEYYAAKGGSKYKCVYYSDSAFTEPIRISTNVGITLPIPDGSQDAPYVNPDAKGFRLPTSDEWYHAARYINDSNNNGILDDGEYYPDDFASGADAAWDVTDKNGITDYDGDGDVNLTSDVAVYYPDYAPTATTATVKSKLPNKLGLYDMSGNVAEWCFNGSATKATCGGYWSGELRIYWQTHYSSNSCNKNVGFRFVRTN
jgi:sulfatase modifying factor 1